MYITNILKESMDIQDIRPQEQSQKEAERITQLMMQGMTGTTQHVIRKYIGKDCLIRPDDFCAKSRFKKDTLNQYLKHYTPEQCCKNQISMARFALGMACFWDDIVLHNARKLEGRFTSHDDAIRMAENQFKYELIMAFHQHGMEAIAYHEKGIDLKPFIDLYYERANNSARLPNKNDKTKQQLTIKQNKANNKGKITTNKKAKQS